MEGGLFVRLCTDKCALPGVYSVGERGLVRGHDRWKTGD